MTHLMYNTMGQLWDMMMARAAAAATAVAMQSPVHCGGMRLLFSFLPPPLSPPPPPPLFVAFYGDSYSAHVLS